MAETTEMQVNEAVKLTGLDAGWANSVALQQVTLWDIGPEKPKYPQRPAVPKRKEGDLEREVDEIEFKDMLEDYQAALKAYKALKKDFDDWHARNGGPVELTFWSCDAHDALDRDGAAVKAGRQARRRYYISARTRGYAKLANRGLPEGMRPGHGQADLERRIREGDAEFEAARRADPVFGNPELRQ